MRLTHKELRDASDPFALPEKNFVGIFRLSKELARDLINQMTVHYPVNERSTGIPIFIRVCTTYTCICSLFVIKMYIYLLGSCGIATVGSRQLSKVCWAKF